MRTKYQPKTEGLSKILYISYLGILEPIPQSQVLPYLLKLSEDTEIFLLSFEKNHLLKKEHKTLKETKDILSQKKIKWLILKYHKYPLIISSFFDMCIGTIFSSYLILRYKIKIIHARASVPVAIGFILKKFFSIKLLYDRRGIMGEEHVENSQWKRGGFLYRFSLWFEKRAIEKSDAIVVLTDKMNKILKESSFVNKNTLIRTIPCCTDLSKFRRISVENNPLKNRFIFVYSGSIGTYNLLSEMFDFFSIASKHIQNAHLLILTPHKERVTDTLKYHSIIQRDHYTLIHALPKEIPNFLSLADVGLIFRQNSPTAIAASPTKMGEYLACGLPIVSLSTIGDTQEIIHSNRIGVLLNSYDKIEYEAAIEKLLILFKEKEALRMRCREAASRLFPLHRGVETYLEVYQRLNID